MHSMHGQAAGSALLEREAAVTGVGTDSSSACPMNPAELLAELREMNRTYRDNQNAWLRLNNQELAIVRRELDCSKGESVKILKEILKGPPSLRLCLLLAPLLSSVGVDLLRLLRFHCSLNRNEPELIWRRKFSGCLFQ